MAEILLRSTLAAQVPFKGSASYVPVWQQKFQHPWFYGIKVFWDKDSKADKDMLLNLKDSLSREDLSARFIHSGD